MSRPTARVLAMLEILQSGGIHRIAALAERLGVDARTVRRYAQHLLALEIPVESVRGRYGGYRLAPGFRMAPLMLTEDEALAVVLSLAATRSRGPDSAQDGAAGMALAKLRRALPAALSTRIDDVLETTSFTESAEVGRIATARPQASTLLSFAEAARQAHPIQFRYEDRSGRRSRRTLLPLGIVAHSGRWYVTGADSLSGEARTFRLDRVTGARVLPGVFQQPPAVDVAETVRATLAGTPWQHQVSVVVAGDPDAIAARVPRGIATIEPAQSSGRVRVMFRAEQLDWIPGMLARLELPFVVEGPPALRELIADVASRFTAASEHGA
jgi:predicted DNA-binding transcriptional regulator YafY